MIWQHVQIIGTYLSHQFFSYQKPTQKKYAVPLKMFQTTGTAILAQKLVFLNAEKFWPRKGNEVMAKLAGVT